MDSDSIQFTYASFLSLLTGPPFAGVVLNWALFGILSNQVYLYFQVFPKDGRMLKTLVYIVYIFEVGQTILLMNAAWNMFGRGIGELGVLFTTTSAWLVICLLEEFVIFLVQCFYAYRIRVILQTPLIPGLILLLSLASFSGATYLVKLGWTDPFPLDGFVLSSLKEPFVPLVVWIGTGAVCNLVVVTCMCYYLRCLTRPAEFQKPQGNLISKAIELIIATGALMAFIPLLTVLLLYLTAGYFEALVLIISKIHSTAMLAVLNSRVKLGIVAESSTWLNNELSIPMSHIREMQGTVDILDIISPSAPQQNDAAFGIKEEMSSVDQRK